MRKKKYVNLMQKTLSRQEMKRLNVIPFPDRAGLMEAMQFDGVPTYDELVERADLVAEMAEAFCRRCRQQHCLIGGAGYFTPFLVDALLRKNLYPAFVWLDKKVDERDPSKFKYVMTDVIDVFIEDDLGE